MLEGKIKKLVAEKGFGFVSGDKRDVFFHCSAVSGMRFEALQVGQSVLYEVEQSDRGPQAVRVQPREG